MTVSESSRFFLCLFSKINGEADSRKVEVIFKYYNIMAEISVSGRMMVKTLKKQFKEEYNLTLRVYSGAKFADEDDSLASLRKGDVAKAGDLKINGKMLVGNFEKKFKEIYGIKVQVANADDSKLVNDSLTLTAASKA